MELNRDLTDVEMDDVLDLQLYGHLGCTLPDGRVYIVPVTFAHDNGFLYAFSCAGQKIEALRNNPAVCFQTELFVTEGVWKSVIVWGTYEELAGKEQIKGSKVIFKRLDREKGTGVSPLYQPPAQVLYPEAARARSGKNAVFYRIRIEQKTGRHVQYD